MGSWIEDGSHTGWIASAGRVAAAVLLVIGLAAPGAATTTQILKKVSYHEKARTPPKVKKECALRTAVPEIFEEDMPDVQLVDKFGRGARLELIIRDVHAPAGGMFSGPKWVRIDGRLMRGGTVIGSFRARRNAVAGTGTCAMLARSIGAIARDVALWIVKPTKGARLGDAK